MRVDSIPLSRTKFFQVRRQSRESLNNEIAIETEARQG